MQEEIRTWGDGDGEGGGGGGGGKKGKRWGWGDRRWRGEAREGAKVGWLMLFYDTWFQLIYVVSCIIREGGGGGEGRGEDGEGERRDISKCIIFFY